jgi:hypothetical protein
MIMIPSNFYKVVKDFIVDLFGTFPELTQNKLLVDISNDDQEQYQVVYDHIVKVIPVHFLSILNEQESMFSEDCYFLPDVNFKTLWTDQISDKTKKIIWKYLKLILFVVMGNDQTILKMFENENVQDKMKDTIDEMKNFFEDNDTSDVHKHLESMMDGKIGSLAKEIAEETVGSNPQEEVIKNMMSDPTKMFSLMSNVGDKITNKIKSGQLKESELIEEATQMLQHMKNMPGMKQFESMFNQFNMPPNLNQNLKKAKTKERLQSKLAKRKEKSPK